MATYHVNVLTKDHKVAASHPLDVEASQGMLAKLAKLAWNVGETGGQIRVTDQAGKLVVVMGVNSARLAFAPS
ncbi:MAG TPA: hypothetical protein VGH40_06720 [Roseiarcus sp.]|jgi:hypothetical protein